VTVLAPGDEAAAPPGSMPAVACEDITYTFGTHTAVDHLNLRIDQGQTFGLLGPNGAGKTNLGLWQFSGMSARAAGWR
jgi:ABC-type uncharacterized transport system ATPase subunit